MPGIGKTNSRRTKQIDLSLTVLANIKPRSPLTLQAIAEVCGTSREAIRQIEARALRKMRELSRDLVQEMSG